MSALAIIAIISICVVVIGAFLGNIFSLLMIEELDRRKPASSLYSRFGFTRWANLETFREYRNACPDGKLHIYELAAFALAMTGVVGLVSVGAYSIMVNQPVVHIISPSDGAIFTAPASIVIRADASKGNISISRVDFYQGATLIGSSTTAPYNLTWSDVPTGRFSLTVKATDGRGRTTTSDAVRITVNAPGSAAP